MNLRRAVLTRIAVLAACAPFTTGVAVAQTPPEPTPTPDQRPTQPPPEVINCARPFADKRNPLLDPNGKLKVSLDLATGAVTVEVLALPAGVTCYAIGREPSGTWPAKFGWSEQEITAIEPFIDLAPRNSAGRYCYQLLFGNSQGHSGQSDAVCIDMPATIAPTPTATPTMGPTPIPPRSPGFPGPAVPSPTAPSTTRATATPVAPEVGNGTLRGEGSGPGPGFAGLAVLLATTAGLAALALNRRR